jgi:hypothetical protein
MVGLLAEVGCAYNACRWAAFRRIEAPATAEVGDAMPTAGPSLFRARLGCMFAGGWPIRELAEGANVWAGDDLMREERS